jgi:beta-lactamase superfamily II metal-dependent hydrolase
MEFAKQPADVRKLQQEIKKREWDVSLIDSSQGAESEVREEGPLIWPDIKKREWDVSLIDSSQGAESEVRTEGPLIWQDKSKS